MEKRYTAVWLLTALVIGISGCRGPKETATATKRGVFRDAPVIIVSIDTLRADHLPAYGYRGVETPNLDAFRRGAILFENAYSHVPLTLPSHVSILSGLIPPENGVRNNLGYTFDSAKHATLPSILKAIGYRTGAAVSAYVLRANTGLGKAFDFYDDAITVKGGEAFGDLQRPGAETVEVANRWIDQQKSSPIFFFLHLFEPHAPYEPPEPFKSRYALAYDGEIAAADAIFGSFVDHLKKSGIYDRAIIVVLSDHGEGLSQHGEEEHGIFLYREDLHVPLMLKLPESTEGGTRVTPPVQLTDVLPTICELVGAKTPPEVKSRSLLAEPDPSRKVYSETLYPRIHLGWSELRSLTDARYQFIESPRPELYDVEADPAETKNVLSEQRRIYTKMRDNMATFDHRIDQPAMVDPEDAAKLKALGYLGGMSAHAAGPLPDPKDRIGDLQQVKSAVQAAADGNASAAIKTLRGVISRNPRFTDAYTQLAETLDKEALYSDAFAARKKAIEVSPGLAGELAVAMAADSIDVNELAQAKTYADLALRSHPGAAHLQLGRIALAQRDTQRAATEARAVLADPDVKLEGMVLLAQAYSRSRPPMLEAALGLLDRARSEAKARGIRPIATLEFARGDCLARLNRIGEAESAFQEEMRLFPHDEQAYASLMALDLLQNRTNDAQKIAEQLVSNNPYRRAYNLATQTFHELGRSREASEWRRRAASARE
jgi:choline-sulfatase